MLLNDLDREEYRHIPIYPLGYGQCSDLPVVICRYSSQNFRLSPLHRHEIVQINYIARGRLVHQINNARYDLVKGDIFVIPPYVPHQLLQVEGSEFEVVELEFLPEFVFGKSPPPYCSPEDGQSVFDFSYIEPFLVSECNVRPRLNLTGKSQLQVESLLDEIQEEHDNRSDGYLMVMRANLLKLLAITGRSFRQSLQNTPAMQVFDYHRDAMAAAVRYVNEHFHEPVTIEQVSRIAHLSQSYFSYLFKFLTQQTFVEYLHGVRIKRAMELLKETDRPIMGICYDCGFNNISHFNRIFKSVAGVCPRTYRSVQKKQLLRHPSPAQNR